VLRCGGRWAEDRVTCDTLRSLPIRRVGPTTGALWNLRGPLALRVTAPGRCAAGCAGAGCKPVAMPRPCRACGAVEMARGVRGARRASAWLCQEMTAGDSGRSVAAIARRRRCRGDRRGFGRTRWRGGGFVW